MIDVRNQKGITLLAISITIVIMVVLTMIPLNLVVKDGGIISQTREADIYMNISGVQERISSDFLIDNNFDNSVKELMNKGYINKFLNASNEELYWITRKGLENMASGYEDDVVDGHVNQKILDDTNTSVTQIETGKIRVGSLDDLIGTNIYVIDRNLNVAYISDKIYGEVEFIKSGTEPENVWWKEK